MNTFFQDYIGKIGTVLLLAFGVITYLAIRFKVTGETFVNLFKSAKKNINDDFKDAQNDFDFVPIDNDLTAEAEDIKSAFEISLEETKPTIENYSEPELKSTIEPLKSIEDKYDDIEIEVETVEEELSETDNLSNKLVEDFGQFDPTLELSKYQFPPLDLLKKYDSEGIQINQDELEENKNKIVETLSNYSIGISNIKATIGPTVTLYEIPML